MISNCVDTFLLRSRTAVRCNVHNVLTFHSSSAHLSKSWRKKKVFYNHQRTSFVDFLNYAKSWAANQFNATCFVDKPKAVVGSKFHNSPRINIEVDRWKRARASVGFTARGKWSFNVNIVGAYSPDCLQLFKTLALHRRYGKPDFSSTPEKCLKCDSDITPMASIPFLGLDELKQLKAKVDLALAAYETNVSELNRNSGGDKVSAEVLVADHESFNVKLTSGSCPECLAFFEASAVNSRKVGTFTWAFPISKFGLVWTKLSQLKDQNHINELSLTTECPTARGLLKRLYLGAVYQEFRLDANHVRRAFNNFSRLTFRQQARSAPVVPVTSSKQGSVGNSTSQKCTKCNLVCAEFEVKSNGYYNVRFCQDSEPCLTIIKCEKLKNQLRRDTESGGWLLPMNTIYFTWAALHGLKEFGIIADIRLSDNSSHTKQLSKLLSLAMESDVLKDLAELGFTEGPKFVPKALVKLVFEYVIPFKSTVLREFDLSCIDKSLLDATAPYPHQTAGIQFVLSKDGRAMLADEMGLGKTIQALGAAAYYRSEWPLLIVCPAAVRYDWLKAIQSWLPTVDESDILSITCRQDLVNRDSQSPAVAITSYDLMCHLEEDLLRMKFGVVILDESHLIKEQTSKRANAALSLLKAANRRILLSGTPALSKPLELHNQFSALDESVLGSRKQFKALLNWSSQGGHDYSDRFLEEVYDRVQKTVLIRRKKQDILTNLPLKERLFVELPINCYETFATLSTACADDFNIKAIDEVYNTGADDDYAEYKFPENTTVSLHRNIFTAFRLTGEAKIDSVLCHVKQNLLSLLTSKKVVLFAHHTSVLNAITSELKKLGVSHVKYDGSTPEHERQDTISRFETDNDCRVAVLSLLSAGVGLNLTAASIAVFAELYWNPSALLQAEDRIHRIGQKQSVEIQYLIAPGTVDDKIKSLLTKKMDKLNQINLSMSAHEFYRHRKTENETTVSCS